MKLSQARSKVRQIKQFLNVHKAEEQSLKTQLQSVRDQWFDVSSSYKDCLRAQNDCYSDCCW